MGITPDSILNKQSKEGYWPGFPKTSNLTNFIVIDSIKKYECKEALEKIKEWTLNHKAKDGIGWGLNDDDKDSQVSFTVNALLTLLPCKESAKSKDIEKAIEFLESKQIKDGGWPSSNLTYPAESTTYATSLVCLILLRTKDINSKNLEASIKFLINSQLPDGSWPLKKGEEKGVHFATCFVIKTLRYYQYLKEKLKEQDVYNLLKNIENKELIINYLINEFESSIRKGFLIIKPEEILDKILATTSSAVKRRKIVLEILENEGEKDTADIIDALKRLEGYKGLHKKSHLAQIKNDMDALLNLGFVEEHNRKYFLVKKI
ncbi:terpene cyclase/mutase family protein [Candidatus Woesearchaeota archaeon]|nr:terpene cyclase/mutase family protein [Candidatus Woesearchaeota archaeon]